VRNKDIKFNNGIEVCYGLSLELADTWKLPQATSSPEVMPMTWPWAHALLYIA
jgi:hypothetical protein